eukprot:gene20333-biopygen14623
MKIRGNPCSVRRGATGAGDGVCGAGLWGREAWHGN